MKREVLGTVRFDSRKVARGHEEKRAERVMKHKNVRRVKDRIRKEMEGF